MTTTTQLLTVRQVAERCQVHPMTVYKAVRDGRLRAQRIGRALRFRPEDVDAWISGG